MQVVPTIFRLYDIRGIAGSSFTEADKAEYEQWYGPWTGVNITAKIARAIGQAYGTFMIRTFKAKKILVGHEERPSADELNEAFIAGILASGCDVTDAGVALTPLVYFSDCVGQYDGAVNITGSHNVSCYNGFKMMGRHAWPIWGDDLQKIRNMIEREDFIQAETPGRLDTAELYRAYEKYIGDHVQLHRPMNIVVDTGNGSAGLFAGRFFRSLGCQVTSLYENVDPTFPNHIPDPEDRASLVELGQRVVAEKADFGVGLDADGDRLGVVDEQGRFIDADMMLLIFAKDVLSRRPGQTILYDVKTSRLLDIMVKKYGGQSLMHMTGHAPIKETMHGHPEIILSGEMSGHMFFVENYFGIDDGLYAAARMLEIVSRSERPFSTLLDGIPQTVRSPEYKLPCSDTEKFGIVEQLKAKFSAQYKTILIDGVRVVFDDTTWALVRASNTAPYLSLRMEADTEERLLEVKNVIADELEKYPSIGDTLNRQHVFSRTGRLGWL